MNLKSGEEGASEFKNVIRIWFRETSTQICVVNLQAAKDDRMICMGIPKSNTPKKCTLKSVAERFEEVHNLWHPRANHLARSLRLSPRNHQGLLDNITKGRDLGRKKADGKYILAFLYEAFGGWKNVAEFADVSPSTVTRWHQKGFVETLDDHDNLKRFVQDNLARIGLASENEKELSQHSHALSTVRTFLGKLNDEDVEFELTNGETQCLLELFTNIPLCDSIQKNICTNHVVTELQNVLGAHRSRSLRSVWHVLALEHDFRYTLLLYLYGIYHGMREVDYQ